MTPIYQPLVFITYALFLLLSAFGAVIFFWIVLGNSRFPVLWVYAHVGLALATFVLFTVTMVQLGW
ncbi:MAG: hypothetical protein C7B46_01675 [Sulfobacillus benefaciens]|uniref:Uncharacterized protein n=1 Tax=Sulfobacillus benefaciens TaxID=453960 RepID=A0A2T2XKX9_9FIRM|nr:MAG: hypothetical protein C7B46_01675 [Sulfobacillus benefaciens]